MTWFIAKYLWWRSRLHGNMCRWAFVGVDHEHLWWRWGGTKMWGIFEYGKRAITEDEAVDIARRHIDEEKG